MIADAVRYLDPKVLSRERFAIIKPPRYPIAGPLAKLRRLLYVRGILLARMAA